MQHFLIIGGGLGALGADGFPDQVVGDDTCRIHCFSKSVEWLSP